MGAARASTGAADAVRLGQCRAGDGLLGGAGVRCACPRQSARVCPAAPGLAGAARYLPAARRYPPGPRTGGGPGRRPRRAGLAGAIAQRPASTGAWSAHGGGTAPIPGGGPGLVIRAPEPAGALAVPATGAVQDGGELARPESVDRRHRAGPRRPVLPAAATGRHLAAERGTRSRSRALSPAQQCAQLRPGATARPAAGGAFAARVWALSGRVFRSAVCLATRRAGGARRLGPGWRTLR